MDDELRKAFATLSAQMSTIASDVSAGTVLQRETISEVKQLTGSVDQLSGRVGRLEAHVFGSNPPPPLAVALVKRTTLAEGDIAEVAGQVIAVKADVAKVKEINEAQSVEIAEVKSKVVLIHDAVTGFFRSPKVRAVGQILFVAATTYAAAKGLKVLP